MIRVDSISLTDETISVTLVLNNTTGFAGFNVYDGDTDFAHDFTIPVSIRGVNVQCRNSVANCDVTLHVLGCSERPGAGGSRPGQR